MAFPISIRPLLDGDRAEWEPIWTAYLSFYETTVPRQTTSTTWVRLLDASEPMHVLGAFGRLESSGEEALLGIVHYLFHRSTWTTGDYCYLQDLFTRVEARGRGVGRALIEAVYEKAKSAGASRVYWLTQDENSTARALYDQVADHPGFTVYRKNM